MGTLQEASKVYGATSVDCERRGKREAGGDILPLKWGLEGRGDGIEEDWEPNQRGGHGERG